MKQGMKDQIKGKFHELKGRAKQKVAEAAGNPQQVTEGREETAAGKAQKKGGEMKSSQGG